MNYLKIFTLIIVLQISVFAKAQNIDSTKFIKSINYTALYFENYPLKPGVKLGVDFLIFDKTKNKIKTRKNNISIKKTRKHQITLGTNIAYFIHPKVYSGIIFFTDISYRKISSSNKIYNFGFGPGYYHAFLPTTYSVLDDGSVLKKNYSGIDYFSNVFIIGFGRYRKNKRIEFVQVNYNAILLYNYNLKFLLS